MKRYYYIICIPFMLIANTIMAQYSAEWSVQFAIATTLPSDAGKQISTGFAGVVTGVHQNHLLVAGGANFPEAMPWQGGKKMYHSEVFVYKQDNAELQLINQHSKLPESIAYSAVCTTSEGILYIGGENENGISNKVWMLQWNQQKQEVQWIAYPSMPIALTNAAATIIHNKVFVAGGETVQDASMQFFELDLNNLKAGWKTLPVLPHAVSHTLLIGLARETKPSLYLIGGRKKNANGISSLYNNMYEYDLNTQTWTEKTALPYTLSAGAGVWYNLDQIVVFGGDRATVFSQVEKLLAAIAAENNPAKKQVLINQKNQLQETHPGFSKEVLLYQANKNTWQVIGTIPYDTPVTTTAIKWNDAVILPSGETKAGVRSPYILKAIIHNKNQ
ncbi:kelch repeat-containing protein [Sediminibacterium sp.]|uniref:Kelch repeat-containing protein n=1 Tax=Sediminibacterium sp. TaxID=1917865 RepID=UPI002734239D|nr:hypothetical protein [Sediminibacterium sp.]MDP3392189.1 hypothetical protein [Sediminibacterium sp.]MDP3567009.1 hypothetical protein [Sediminibacterium sp.]